MCPLCRQECRRETLTDGFLCGSTGLVYVLDDTGKIAEVLETNRTQPSAAIRQRVKWVTVAEAARVKSAS